MIQLPGWQWRVVAPFETRRAVRVEFVIDGVVCNAVKIEDPTNEHEAVEKAKEILMTWVEERLLPRTRIQVAWQEVADEFQAYLDAQDSR